MQRFLNLLPAIALLALLLAALHLLSDVTRDDARPGRLYPWLLLVNAIGLGTLVALIAAQGLRLIRQVRAKAAGAVLTVRMLALIVPLGLFPAGVVFYYSQQFIARGIDAWLDVQTGKALESALGLSRASLELRVRERLAQTRVLLKEMPESGGADAALRLDEHQRAFDAQSLTLLAGGRILASSHVDPSVLVPELPSTDLLQHMRQATEWAGIEPSDSGLVVRVLVREEGERARMLHAVYPVAVQLSDLATAVQGDYARYRELAYLREPLRDAFLLTLRLVLLFSILAATWVAVYFAHRLTEPIRDLADGTRAVAAGDYDKQLPGAGGGDLGFLVQSFNEMTRRIARARATARESQAQVERERSHLQTVLDCLSSGVLTLDAQGVLRGANRAAEQLLGQPLAAFVGQPVTAEHTRFDTLAAAIAAHSGQAEWRDEVTLSTAEGTRILLCRGAPLAAAQAGSAGGQVVVFDDVTALVDAQRQAAWAEVARRLAHEIRNPLTPIKLSAERLRHKLLKALPAEQAEVLDRATSTIAQQVESMNEMVKAFSEYARLPPMRERKIDLNRLVTETLELYRGHRLRIEARLDPALPPVLADPDQLRQVLHNLLRNAFEAVSDVQDARVAVTTWLSDEAGGAAGFHVEDNGPGFPDEVRSRSFEPYVTTKHKGTGLGLAIVRKIADEHGASVHAGNLAGGGARVEFRLPRERLLPGVTA